MYRGILRNIPHYLGNNKTVFTQGMHIIKYKVYDSYSCQAYYEQALVHYAQKLSYYAMLLCSKNYIIMLPSPSPAPIMLMQANLRPCHVIYHMAKANS